MRKFVALAAVAVAGLLVARQAQDQRREAELWAEVTDAAPTPQSRAAR